MRPAAALLALLAAASLAAAPPLPVRAQTSPAPTATPRFRPVPGVPDAVTHHAIVLHGKRIAYTARAGTLLLRDAENEPTASVFYVAYTADGPAPARRPVTFFWNGGPGSSSIWLHMGSFGPVRVAVPSDARQPRPEVALETNESSLLDRSDLVFIDAVGTGYSVVAGRAQPSQFWGVDQDAKAFTRIIETWLTRNGRWNSPKFLFGESYGTTRAANVVNRLEDDGVSVSGVTLLSSALDYSGFVTGSGGEDLAYEAFLPTEAAVAWYHRRVPSRPADLDRFLGEVRRFAGGEYARALLRGDALDAATRRSVAARIHAYTGLSETFVERANLRVDPGRFEHELLRDRGLAVGRLDGRYTLPLDDANAERPDLDVSDTQTATAYVSALNHYLHDVLHYRDERRYEPLAYEVIRAWDFTREGDDAANAPNVIGDLRAALRKNPYLRVFSANGYFDLATPFYGTEYALDHLALPSARSRITYGYYPSGHEIYLNRNALAALRGDLDRFYVGALATP